MQLKLHVSHDFNQMVPTDKALFAVNVTNLLTTNAPVNFPDLPFTVAQLIAANDDLLLKYEAFKLQGAVAKGAFIESEETWKTMFNRTAEYIDLVANGSLAIINLSGFHPTKSETVPAQLPAAPVADMEISNNERGMITASAKSVAGAKGYVFGVSTPDMQVEVIGNQVTFKVGNSFASIIVGTKRDVKFQNLPSAEVVASVAAFNSAGLGTFTDAIDVKIP